MEPSEDLVTYSYEQGKRVLEKREANILKEHGQFLTSPSAVATFQGKLKYRRLKLANKHSKLEAAIVEEFSPRFAPGAKLIYLDGTTKKLMRFDIDVFAKFDISDWETDKFPDVILYDSKRKRLFLIEAATAQDFISPKRRSELEKLFGETKIGKIYITAFWSFASYTKHLDKIAWETEVWIAEMPSHMIHYNGEKFLGPRK